MQFKARVARDETERVRPGERVGGPVRHRKGTGLHPNSSGAPVRVPPGWDAEGSGPREKPHAADNVTVVMSMMITVGGNFMEWQGNLPH